MQQCQCQCQSKFFSVAKVAGLLQSPQRRRRVTIQNQEMIVEKEMFLDIDGKQVATNILPKYNSILNFKFQSQEPQNSSSVGSLRHYIYN